MIGYLGRNLLQFMAVILGVLSIVFVFSCITGDPIALYAPLDATPAQREALRKSLGLNDPLPVRYWLYMERSVHGDFGNSIRMGKPAMPLVLERVPATVELGITGLLLAMLVGVSIGILSALKPNSWIDSIGRFLALGAQAMPTFWLGLIMIIIFSVRFRILPAFGIGGIKHLIMPAITYALYNIPIILRLTRSTVFDVIHQDYVRTARAKGLPERVIVFTHIFRNALIPVITILGMNFGYMLAGAIVIEKVFSWPGIGMLTIDAIFLGDYPITMASTLVLVFGVVSMNFLVDIFYAFLDPRIRLGIRTIGSR